MNKKDFLQKLADYINVLPKAEKERLLNYYSEILEDRIEEGKTEEEAVLSLEKVEDIANQLLAEHKIEKPETPGKISGTKRNLILALTSPLWIFGVCAYLMLLLAGYLIIGSLILTLGALLISFAAGTGIGIFSLFIVFPISAFQGMLNLSVTITCAGLFIFSLWGCKRGLRRLLYWGKWMTLKTAMLFKAFFGIKKKEGIDTSANEKIHNEDTKEPGRYRKAYLWTATGFTFSGLLLMLVLFSKINFDVENLNPDPPLTENTYECSINGINEILIDTSYISVKVVPATDDILKVRYMENKKEGYQIDNNGSSLSITHISNRNWKENFLSFRFSNSSKNSLCLELPEQYEGNLKLETSNSPISVKDFQNLSEVQITSSYNKVTLSSLNISGDLSVINPNGSIVFSDVNAMKDISCNTSYDNTSLNNVSSGGNISVINSNGSIVFSDVNAMKDISCNTSYDSMSLNNVSSGGNITLKNPNGIIEMEELTTKGRLACKFSYDTLKGNLVAAHSVLIDAPNSDVIISNLEAATDITINLSYGDLSLSEVLAQNTLNLTASNSSMSLDAVTGTSIICETSYNDILFTELSGDNITLQASNGDVSGSIAGNLSDYRLSGYASYGKSNLPEKSSGSKSLEAISSYGDIDIRFRDMP